MSSLPPSPPLTPTCQSTRQFFPQSSYTSHKPRYTSKQEVWLKATDERPNMRVVIIDYTKDIYGEWRYQIEDKDGSVVDNGRWFDQKALT